MVNGWLIGCCIMFMNFSSVMIIGLLVFLNCTNNVYEGEIIISSACCVSCCAMIRQKTKWLLSLSPETNSLQRGLRLAQMTRSESPIFFPINGVTCFIYFMFASLLGTLMFNNSIFRTASLVSCLISEGVIFLCMIWFMFKMHHQVQPDIEPKIITIHVSLYRQEIDHQDETIGDCSVCLEDLSNGPFVQTICKHSFHEECLYKWLKSQAGLARESQQEKQCSCPNCRMTIASVTVENN